MKLSNIKGTLKDLRPEPLAKKVPVTAVMAWKRIRMEAVMGVPFQIAAKTLCLSNKHKRKECSRRR